jgi:two-component system cell cycle response regulator
MKFGHDTVLARRLQAIPACRVLVVDDDDLMRARLTALLRMAEYEVETAASGEEALRILSAEHCHILLTDWQMPDMDGLSLCRRVRANAADSYVYTLILSVRNSKQDLLAGLAAGADDYIAKSAPLEEILARLEVARRITQVEKSPLGSPREAGRLAATDALTGAYSLRYLMNTLPRELARSQRYGHPLALLSCGIDRLEYINEDFGYAAGNDLLQAFVARAASCIRKASDWIARVGGNEFLVVLPETDVIGAGCVAQKLRAAFACSPVSTHAGAVNFTASIGITAIEPQPDIRSTADHRNQATASGSMATKINASSRNGGKNGLN